VDDAGGAHARGSDLDEVDERAGGTSAGIPALKTSWRRLSGRSTSKSVSATSPRANWTLCLPKANKVSRRTAVSTATKPFADAASGAPSYEILSNTSTSRSLNCRNALSVVTSCCLAAMAKAAR
jgi:hypothetical protein